MELAELRGTTANQAASTGARGDPEERSTTQGVRQRSSSGLLADLRVDPHTLEPISTHRDLTSAHCHHSHNTDSIDYNGAHTREASPVNSSRGPQHSFPLLSSHRKRVANFYSQQNALIDALIAHTRFLRQVHEDGEGEEVGVLREDVGLRDAETGALGHGEEEEPHEETGSASSPQATSAVTLSFMGNVLLLVIKIWVVVATGSVAVLASAVDSVLDLLSGLVLVVAHRAAHHHQKNSIYKYPEGKARIEPLGILIFSTVMCVSGLSIVLDATRVLVKGLTQREPELNVSVSAMAVLFTTVVVKVGLYLYCRAMLKLRGHNAAVDAYMQDHFNDVTTNFLSILCVAAATHLNLWFMDSLGAICLSLWIMYNWMAVGAEHISQLAGLSADPQFLQKVTFLALNADERIRMVDTVRAFYMGMRLFVEVHIVLSPEMTLREAHDIGERLEDIIQERESEVERCFVHLDYEADHQPEYVRRLARNLQRSPSSD